MHKLFLLLTITMFGKAYGNTTFDDLKNASMTEKLYMVVDLIEGIRRAENVPQDGVMAAHLRNSTIHPIFSKNRSLGYCINGVMPISRGLEAEIPFRIGRKKACKKSVTKMLEKANRLVNKTYNPYYGNALRLKKVVTSILDDDKNLPYNNPDLYIALRRVDQYTVSNISFTIENKRYSVLKLLKILQSHQEVDMNMGYRNFAIVYQRLFDAFANYTYNFRYEGFNKYLNILREEVKKNL